VAQIARGRPIQLALGGAGTAPGDFRLAAAGDAAGDLLRAYPVVLSGPGNSAAGIEARRIAAGGSTSGTPIRVLASARSGQAAIFPVAAMNPAGAFVLAEDSLESATAGGASPASEQSLVLPPAGHVPFTLPIGAPAASNPEPSRPVLAMDDAGNFVVVWRASGNAIAELYDQHGAPRSGPIVVAGNILSVSVAMDPATGDFVVAWDDGNGVSAQRFRSNGGRDGALIRVAVNATLPAVNGQPWSQTTASDPVVGMDVNGDFVVAYSYAAVTDGRGKTSHRLLARQYDAGLPPVTVAVSDPHDAATPEHLSLAMNATGSFVVAWDRVLTDQPEPSPVPAAQGVAARLFTPTDLAITVTDRTPTYVPGTSTTYTIVVSNTGPVAVSGASVRDLMPAAVSSDTWTAKSSAGASVALAAGSGNVATAVSLVPGASVTFTITAAVSPSAAGDLVNTATVTPSSGLGNPGSNSATDTDAPRSQLDLAITLFDPSGTYTAGAGITYTIVVRNNGPSAVTGASVVDNLPAAVRGDTWTASASPGAGVARGAGSGNIATTVDLLPGASVTFIVAAEIDTSASGDLVNTATVAAPPGVTDVNPSNNQATDIDAPQPLADLAVTNTDPTGTYTAGGTITYTVLVSNAGPSAVEGASVSDTLPGAVTNAAWTAVASPGASVADSSGSGNIATTVDLLPGASVTFTVVANIDPSTLDDLTATATVAAPAGVSDPNLANNTATDTDTPLGRLSQISLSKSLYYTQIAGGVAPMPAGAIFGSAVDQTAGAFDTATLAYPGPGSPQTYLLAGTREEFFLPDQQFTTQAEMDAAFPFGSYVASVTNSATGATATDTIDYRNDAFTSDVPALDPASFQALQGLDPTQPVTVAFNAFTPGARADDAVTFFTIFGPPGVVFSMAVPPSTTSVTIPASTLQSNTQCTFDIDFSDRIRGNSTTPTVIYEDVRTDGGFTTTRSADLAITKTDPTGTYTAGGSITYTIVVSNNGPDTVTGANVADAMPSAVTGDSWSAVASAGAAVTAPTGTDDINDTVDLQPGATVTFTVTADIDAAATGDISNTTTVTPPADVSDPNPFNNSATDVDTTFMPPVADLAITNTDPTGTYTPGGTITYTVVVSNDGPSAVTGAPVADILPPAVTSATWSATASGVAGVADSSGSGNIVTTVDLQPGASVTFTLVANIDPTATGDLITTATVAAPVGVTDPEPTNNRATDTDLPSPQADLGVTNTDASGTYTAGTPLTYTVVVSNNGPSAVRGASVSDTLPGASTGATWTAAASAGASVADAGGSGDIATTVDLLPGASVTFTIIADIDPSASGSLVNTAEVAAPPGVTDPDTGNNRATDTDAPEPVVNLMVTAVDGTTLYVPGTTTTYTIVVTNLGPSTAGGAPVTVRFPAAITAASWRATASGGSDADDFSGSGNIATAVDLPPGASVTFTVAAAISASAAGDLATTASVDPAGAGNPGGDASADIDVPVPIPATTPAQPPPTVTPASQGGAPPASSTAGSINANAPVIGALEQPGTSRGGIGAVVGPLARFTSGPATPLGTVPVQSPPEVPIPPGVPVTVPSPVAALMAGDIAGVVFFDRNDNGVRDPGEAGIAGLTVFIDTHGDGLYQLSDPYTVTNERGEYVFHNLPLNKTYEIRQLTPPYMAQTYPLKDGSQVVVLTDAHPSETGVVFGSVPFRPSGPTVRPAADSSPHPAQPVRPSAGPGP
jgi:uncharacterized repeat protein (TIGR01451 family)